VSGASYRMSGSLAFPEVVRFDYVRESMTILAASVNRSTVRSGAAPLPLATS
jgi:hypothetical protein